MAHPVGARVWAVSEGFAVTPWQYAAGETVAVKMLVGTQTGRQEFEDAALRSFTVGARNDQPWTPGRVMVNGHEGGVITGPATITWRRRDGGAPVVALQSDDMSYGSALSRIVVKSGGRVVQEMIGVEGESWRFVDELDLNGGDYLKDIVFEVCSQKAGYSDSYPATISVRR